MKDPTSETKTAIGVHSASSPAVSTTSPAFGNMLSDLQNEIRAKQYSIQNRDHNIAAAAQLSPNPAGLPHPPHQPIPVASSPLVNSYGSVSHPQTFLQCQT